jgi:hypothetical protein
MPLLCAQDALATSGIVRMVNARPGARTRLRSTWRPLRASSRRLASLQAARSLCHASGMHASRRQHRRRASGKPPPVARACVTMVIVRSERGCAAPEWLLLAACRNYLGISCMSADPRATGRPWATAGGTGESHVARLFTFSPPMGSVRSRTGQWACELIQLPTISVKVRLLGARLQSGTVPGTVPDLSGDGDAPPFPSRSDIARTCNGSSVLVHRAYWYIEYQDDHEFHKVSKVS